MIADGRSGRNYGAEWGDVNSYVRMMEVCILRTSDEQHNSKGRAYRLPLRHLAQCGLRAFGPAIACSLATMIVGYCRGSKASISER